MFLVVICNKYVCYEGFVSSVIRFTLSLLSNIQIALVWIRNFVDKFKTKTAAAATTTNNKQNKENNNINGCESYVYWTVHHVDS